MEGTSRIKLPSVGSVGVDMEGSVLYLLTRLCLSLMLGEMVLLLLLLLLLLFGSTLVVNEKSCDQRPSSRDNHPFLFQALSHIISLYLSL